MTSRSLRGGAPARRRTRIRRGPRFRDTSGRSSSRAAPRGAATSSSRIRSTARRRAITNSPAADDDEPAWSGELGEPHIAFQSKRSGNTDIYVVDTDGSNEQRLTTGAAADTEPAWSPDEAEPRIAFVSTRDGNQRDLLHGRGRQRRAPPDERSRGRRRSGVVAERRANRVREQSQRHVRPLHDEGRRDGRSEDHAGRRRRPPPVVVSRRVARGVRPRRGHLLHRRRGEPSRSADLRPERRQGAGVGAERRLDRLREQPRRRLRAVDHARDGSPGEAAHVGRCKRGGAGLAATRPARRRDRPPEARAGHRRPRLHPGRHGGQRHARRRSVRPTSCAASAEATP